MSAIVFTTKARAEKAGRTARSARDMTVFLIFMGVIEANESVLGGSAILMGK
jgi:hypothetical protein